MIPAHGKIPRHAPQVINSDIPPGSLQFAIAIQTPNLLYLTTELFPEDLSESISEITKSSGEDHDVRVKRTAVFEPHPGLGELLEYGVVFESDLSVNNHLASPDVCERRWVQKRNWMIETEPNGTNQSSILRRGGIGVTRTQIRPRPSSS